MCTTYQNDKNNILQFLRTIYNPMGSQGSSVGQSQHTCRWLNRGQPNRLVHTMRDQKYERILIFRCRRKLKCPEQRKPTRWVWNQQIKFTYNHWLAALVKGKCTSTKPTCFITGVGLQNPLALPGLNQGPIASHAKALPVCHTAPTGPQ